MTVEIRKKCAQFDRQSQRATRQNRIILGMSHEGSEITALDFEGQTRKMQVMHLSVTSRIRETIYLENGRPIWVKRVQSTYDAPLSGRVAEREEDNLYFADDQLIQRDLYRPIRTVGRVVRRKWNLVHQTSISSPQQAREWKAKALEWQQKVAQYQRALAAKS